MLQLVDVGPRAVAAYREFAPEGLMDTLARAAARLRGARVLHLNATPYGGGVSELLRSVVPILNDLGIVAHWRIIRGDDRFFQVTKKIHNGLQGAQDDLTEAEREAYLSTSRRNAELLKGEYDFVFLHDPQPAGILSFREKGSARWIWRCHIDTAQPNAEVWAFLHDYLEQRGASFLSDIARGTGLLKVKAEEALWQLVAHGFATGDGIAGLRILLTPENKRQGRRRLRVISGGRAVERLMPVGRWSLWRSRTEWLGGDSGKSVEHKARQLLRRYGIVFRDLLARETYAPSWRSLLGTYRRLESRGEIRGGRFVNGFVGEQFALPEAVESLRAVRKRNDSAGDSHDIKLSASDPLNLAGVILPGSRVPAVPSNFVVFRDGVMVRTVLGRDSEQGTARATNHSFDDASAKQVEQAVVSFRRHCD